MKITHLLSNRNIMRFMLPLFIVAGILIAIVNPAYAQSPVYAEVDRTSISIGDTLTFSIVVNGSDSGVPDVPMLDGFQVLGSSKSSQLSIINGVISAQASYHYILAPTRAGMLTIPSIPVPVDGQDYSTQPITIEVVAGNAPVQPVQPVKPIAP